MLNNIIRVIDLETTGTNATDKVCDVGYVDVDADGAHLLCSRWGNLVNPQIPIPPEISAIHHIIDEDVKDASKWEEVTPYIFNDDSVIAYAAHNAKFERQFCTDKLTGDAPWICTYKCGLRLWPDAPSHSNQALRYYNKYTLDRAFANQTHRALPDAYVTAHHVCELLKMASIDDLIKWSNEPALQVRCNIGKQRGMKWSDVGYSFLVWVSERDFDEDVIFTVETEMRKRQEKLKILSRAGTRSRMWK